MAIRNVQQIIERMKDRDFDIRIMAISDVSNTLKDTSDPLPKDDGKALAVALTNALTDNQSQVQNNAMECLGVLFRFIPIETMDTTVTSICNNIGNKALADRRTTLSATLRSVLNRLPDTIDDSEAIAQMAEPVCKVLTTHSDALTSEVKVDLVDTLSTLLVRAGEGLGTNANLASTVQGVLLGMLESDMVSVRKRAIVALGKFIIHVPDQYSDEALNFIMERYSTSNNDIEASNYLRVLVTIARQKPLRIANLLNQILERELSVVDSAEGERRVTSLMALETAVTHSPELIGDKLDRIYDAGSTAISFDPNYNYEADEDEDIDDDYEFGDEFDGDFDDDVYEDDEDDSWSVRLGAVKLLAALEQSKLTDAHSLIAKVGDSLIKRFKEREDVVRSEVLVTYAILLDVIKRSIIAQDEQGMDVESGLVEAVEQQALRVVPALLAAVKAYPKSTETKQLEFAIFARLIDISPMVLDSLLGDITKQVVDTLNTSESFGILQSASTRLVNANLKLDVLELLGRLFGRHQITPELFQFISAISALLTNNFGSTVFQVPSTSLAVAEKLVVALRASADEHGTDVSSAIEWVQQSARSVLDLINSNDQAVRTSAIGFASAVTKCFGDLIGSDVLAMCLTTLAAKDKSSALATTSIQALAKAIALPTHVPQQVVVASASSLLESAAALLKLGEIKSLSAGLELVKSLTGYGAAGLAGNPDGALDEILGVVGRHATSVPPVALAVLTHIVPLANKEEVQRSIDVIIKTLSAAAVHDPHATVELCRLFEAVGSHYPGIIEGWRASLFHSWSVTYGECAALRNYQTGSSTQYAYPENSLSNTGKCLFALYNGMFMAQNASWSSDHLADIIRLSPSTDAEVANLTLALRTFGIAATHSTLPKDTALIQQLDTHLSSSHEDVRSEAALALGNYVGQHTDVFGDLFASAVARDAKYQTNRIQAVKTATDVIVRTNSSGAIIDSVWQLLSQFVLGAQETVPDLIPQSLAVFGLVYPEQYLSQIAANTGSSNSVAATAFVTAFRVILSDKTVDARFDAHVKSALPKVLENLGHKDIDIRRLTLLLLYSVAQNKPSQLISLVKGFEPALYKQTEVDESLIRIITMGPFKKRIDDGLDARRVAFQCVYMLVRNIPDEITPSETAVVVARGIDDEADILGTTRLIVKELLVLSPSSLLSRLESVAEAVTKLASKKLTGTALRQEVESLRENVVSSFVIFVSLERLAKKSSSLMAKAMAKDGAYEKLRAVIANGSDDKIVATYDNANEILNRSE